MTVVELNQVMTDRSRYWGERDLRAYHLISLVHEFPTTCLIAHGDDGIRGYVIGFVTPDRVGYLHLVATRDDARGTGLGRRLWKAFSDAAAKQGADRLRAITTLANTGSRAFHQGLGFDASVEQDYNGPGDARVVFQRALF